MELLLALTVGVLTGTGVYLLLRARSFDVILGLTLLSYAVNVFIFLMGRIAIGKPPILTEGVTPALAHYADPLPQALVLTAIVISFAMTALMLVIALRTYAETGSDHVDGVEPTDDAEKATATNAAHLSAGAPAAGEARR
jgi:multicomponent K+:H+ antiporter subunit C